MRVGATVQVSGVTANDFTSPVIYTVVAADASTRDYTVTVSSASAAKEITSFVFTAQQAVPGGATWVSSTVPSVKLADVEVV